MCALYRIEGWIIQSAQHLLRGTFKRAIYIYMYIYIYSALTPLSKRCVAVIHHAGVAQLCDLSGSSHVHCFDDLQLTLVAGKLLCGKMTQNIDAFKSTVLKPGEVLLPRISTRFSQQQGKRFEERYSLKLCCRGCSRGQ